MIINITARDTFGVHCDICFNGKLTARKRSAVNASTIHMCTNEATNEIYV